MLAPEHSLFHFVGKFGAFLRHGHGLFREAAYVNIQLKAVCAHKSALYGHGLCFSVGVKLRVNETHLVDTFDIQPACDAQPVCLCILRGHMTARNRAGNVVNHNCDTDFLTVHKLGYIVAVSRAEAVLRAHKFAVYPQIACTCTLHNQIHLTALLLRRNFHGTLVKRIPLKAMRVGKISVAPLVGNGRFFHLLNRRRQGDCILKIRIDFRLFLAQKEAPFFICKVNFFNHSHILPFHTIIIKKNYSIQILTFQ